MSTSLIKERQNWQAEVEAQFEEAMEHIASFDITERPRARTKEQYLTSYLSDVQEQMLHNPQEANENLNRIKFMINCCF